MRPLHFLLLFVLIGSALGCAPKETATMHEDTGMSFFITSVGPGNGADLGGPAEWFTGTSKTTIAATTIIGFSVVEQVSEIPKAASFVRGIAAHLIAFDGP